ncbi:MAG: hypothetical protein EOM72_04915 [Opitutae bacterium]|nr:hypothetical protein [Opitutae bacterium]
MNPVLRQSLAAGLEILRRHAWLPLGVFLLHEGCAHVVDGYARWPAIDIPLHFLGGFAIAHFAGGALRVFAGRGLVRPPDPLLRILLLFALAGTAAVFWEFAEWTADRFFGTHCQLSLADTLLDLLMGMLGGLAFLLPQLPAALRAFFTPAPGPQP